MLHFSYYNSPLGILEIVADERDILAINFVKNIKKSKDNTLTKQCVIELKEYFNGQRRVFEVPVKLSGTIWQQKVLLNLSKIPYASIISYGDLAAMTGNAKAARAVGGAVNQNKIPIIIPCHRVLGGSGQLVGYAGGLAKKATLLSLEQSFD
ncbi:MAG: methylated-DNA--[protein]-cysteine S-methyltransferase [Patescibacteria group bacterium]